ncbi:MAG TPA: hypothetical protein VFQ45_16655 [Longimicrobium sp.]|nr:hypothetical protein [Longimicrobium sp.]
MSLTETIPQITSPGTPPQYQYRSNVVPRLQWNYNSGYCGETSFICAGLSFGQYCSQWTARELASPGIWQIQPDSQLLVGSGNDMAAARRMRLQASGFYSVSHDNTPELIVWAKSHLVAGHVPIIGVFINGDFLENWTSLDDGDQQYDHIVPILGFDTALPYVTSAGQYLPGDWITLSDNGLYGPTGDPPAYPFLYSYEVDSFQGTREQANQADGLMYTLSNTPPNYAIAIEGVLDLDGVCVPVSLSCSDNFEPAPTQMQNPPAGLSGGPFADQPPTPMDIELAVTVELPDQTVDYNLYMYDHFDAVPVAGFNAAAGNAVQRWQIPAGSGPTYQVVPPIATTSDQTRVFRAVPASAP